MLQPEVTKAIMDFYASGAPLLDVAADQATVEADDNEVMLLFASHFQCVKTDLGCERTGCAIYQGIVGHEDKAICAR